MSRIKMVFLLAIVSLPASHAFAGNILSPSDFIIAIDNNRNLPGNTNTGAEGPGSAFDGNNASKWLDFGRSFTGLIVTPTGGASVVQSLNFTTGGDAPERDPILFQLFGTNSAITSVNDGTGLSEPWTLIGGGATGFAVPTSPATARNTTVAAVNVPNATAYTSYKVLFTKLRSAGTGAFDPVTLANAANPNSIQLSEIRLFDAPNGGGTDVALTPTNPVAFDQTDSFFPPTERPIEAIDGSKGASSKYLNFGREGAGLIITPAIGKTLIDSLQITTANDTEGRDPSAYEIYGTNALITSIDDSEGNSEPWTLISSGAMVLPSTRNTDGGIISFINNTAYTSYKVIFPDNKGPDGGGVNSIQFSEIALFGTAVPEPATLSLIAVGAICLLGRRFRRTGCRGAQSR